MTMEGMAHGLSSPLGRPVLNLTGLQGEYDIDVSFDLGVRGVAGASDAPQAGSIFSVFPEKLGLRLDSGKLPLKVLVVDHIERTPTEN